MSKIAYRIFVDSALVISVALLEIVLLSIFACLLSCSTPVPRPTPFPDSGVVDIFTDAIVDCERAASPAPTDQVLACLDVAEASPCLVALYPQHSADTIACTVQLLSMTLHVELARGDAGAQAQSRATSANSWVRSHRLGYR